MKKPSKTKLDLDVFNDTSGEALTALIKSSLPDKNIKRSVKRGLGLDDPEKLTRFLVMKYEDYVGLEFFDWGTNELEASREMFFKRTNKELSRERIPLDVRYLFREMDSEGAREYVVRRLPMPTDPKLVKARRQFRDRGLTPHVFEAANIRDILSAIEGGIRVEGLDILEKIKDSKFRFITPNEPTLSASVSESLAIVYRLGRSVEPEIQKKAVAKLKENADDFARKMYSKISELQREEKISSYRDTVRVLNERKVPSYRGGEWHVNTLQLLTKRWKELDLFENDKQKPE